MTTKSGYLTGKEVAFAVLIFFLAGIFFGIVIGIKIERGGKIDDDQLRADVEMIKEHAELAAELDRILVIYNQQLKEVLQNYMQAMQILKNGR